MSETSEIVKSELTSLFGASDLLLIIGIKSKETYLNSCNDSTLLRLAYLREVLKNHPNSSGLTTDTLDGVKEALIRSKKLYVMKDVFNLFSGNKDQGLSDLRDKYLQDGVLPDLPSLKFLRLNTFKGDFEDFEIPQFEDVAAELRSLYQERIQRIRELQEEDLQAN